MLRIDKEWAALGSVTQGKLHSDANRLVEVASQQGLSSGLLSVAGISTVTKSNLGRRGSILICWLLPIKAGRQGRNLKQKPARSSADPLPFSCGPGPPV